MRMDLKYLELALFVLVLILLIQMPLQSGTTGRFIQNRPPTVEITKPREGDTLSGDALVKWSASDPDGDSLTYTLSYSRYKDTWTRIADTNEKTYHWDTSGLSGDYFLKVEASDGKETREAVSGRFYIKATENAVETPSVAIDTPSEDTTITAGDSLYFSGDVSGLESPKYLWDFDGGAANSFSEDPGYVKFGKEGVYHVTFSVQSKGMWYKDEVTVTVEKKNECPKVSLITPVGGEVINGTYAVRWSASDPDGDSLTYTVKYSRNNGLTWSMLTRTNATVYQWDTTDFFDSNYYKILVSATDGKLTSETESQRFTVKNGGVPANQQPIVRIDSPEEDVTIVVGDSLYFSGFAMDPDGTISALYWDFDGGAANAFVKKPGNVRFDREGVFDVSFNARDDKGLWSVSKTVRVTVLSGFVAHLFLPGGWKQSVMIDGTEENYEFQRLNLRKYQLKIEKPGNWGLKFRGINVSADVSVDLSDAIIEIGTKRGMKHDKWLELKNTLNISDSETFDLTLPKNGVGLEKCDDSGTNCFDVTKNVTKISGSARSSTWEIPVWLGFTTYNTYGNESYVPINVTINNVAPVVSNVLFDDEDLSPTQEIDLTADDAKTVWCNATVTDTNGYLHVSKVNATIYKFSVDPYASDDNNSHYTNDSCELTGGSGTTVDARCAFRVWYYADASSWNCSITAWDQANAWGNGTANSTVNSFLGLYVFNSSVDFGTIAMGDNSSAQVISVKNTCNQQIDIKLWESNWSGNLSCDGAGSSNISTQVYLAYNETTTFSTDNSSTLWYNNVDPEATYSDFNLPYTTVDGTNSTKTLYFKLFVPRSGISGSCSGVLSFQAIGDT